VLWRCRLRQLAQVGKDVITYVESGVVEGGKVLLPGQRLQHRGRLGLEQFGGDHYRVHGPAPADRCRAGHEQADVGRQLPNETGFIVDRKAEACAESGAFTQMTTMPKDSTSWNDANVVEGGTLLLPRGRDEPGGQIGVLEPRGADGPVDDPVAPGTLKVGRDSRCTRHDRRDAHDALRPDRLADDSADAMPCSRARTGRP